MTNRDKAKEEPKKPIEPLEGWKLQSDQGYMRCGREPTDRLVLLSDVVLWLMETQELPCRLAVDEISNALLGCAGVQVFIVSRSDHAKLVTELDSFFYLPIISFWDEQPIHKPDDFGLAGAVKRMHSFWGESSSPLECDYMGKHLLEPLSVRFDVAHALWGWGHVAEEVKPLLSLVPKESQPVVKAHDSGELTPEQIRAARAKNKGLEWKPREDELMVEDFKKAKAKIKAKKYMEVSMLWGVHSDTVKKRMSKLEINADTGKAAMASVVSAIHKSR
jgi:hypothetical protein